MAHLLKVTLTVKCPKSDKQVTVGKTCIECACYHHISHVGKGVDAYVYCVWSP